jgi:UDP-N-acetylmuramate dehydrogenase
MADKVLQKLSGVSKDVLLKDYTTYKIGGPAKYFFDAETKEDLANALKTAKYLKLKVFILGGGSNLLISDKGFNGLVVKIDIKNIDFQGNKAAIGAGASLSKIANLSAEKGFSGLEWSAGIPGATLGGSIYGHAQAFGTKISSCVKSVQAIDTRTLKIINFLKKECQFSLKNSIFKKNKNLIIVSAILRFKEGNKEEIKNKVDEFINYRKTKHPINFPSAGSTFVNPEIQIKSKKLLEKYPELNDFNAKGTIPAGFLIAKCGLAGKKIGGAQFSPMHANFIINLGGAKAKDVRALMKIAKEKVKKEFKINLETEVQFVGFKKE